MSDKYAWKDFGRSLDRLQDSLRDLEYRGIFESRPTKRRSAWDKPAEAVEIPEIDSILSEAALGPPHRLDLLVPPPGPEIPKLPTMPDKKLMASFEARHIERYEKLKGELEAAQRTIAEKIRQNQIRGAELATDCKNGDTAAIKLLMLATLTRHPLPKPLALDAEFSLDRISRVAVCTIHVPDPAKLPIVVERTGYPKWRPVSDTKRKRSSEHLLHSLCIRAAYLVAMNDPVGVFDTVAVNAFQKWFDPATGAPREGIVASLQATKDDLCQLHPGHLDSKACFRHLSGISTPNILNAVTIRPIFVMNTNDDRVIANKDVASRLEDQTNLAAMPWDDFEHLMRQLFEWMFLKDGVDIKVTRASRDRGVDAIMFDPDPIRGGKYVLQAKRYTRTVDVAAVRDLYGTVVNEGANRGILVTTASYGPDAYEFAKDKPISLIDGPNLIVLLRKHGRTYRIDLEEARRLDAAQ
jgi:restriction system protein